MSKQQKIPIPRYRTSANAASLPKHYVYIPSDSETVPDQSLSVNEMLSRYQRGLPITGYTPQYYDEDDYPNLADMDILEIKELRDKTLSQISDLEHQQTLAAKALDKKHRDAANQKLIDDEVQRKINEREKANL